MQIKVGAFLTNMMCKNLKFKMNNHKFMLLKPQVFKTKKKTQGGVSKSMGYVLFNRGFID
jgi:hypothetical protein